MRPVGRGQIRQVWFAYLAGCRTIGEVSAITGLEWRHCHAYTWELIQRGRLERAGFAPRLEGQRGKASVFYAPAVKP